MGLVFLAGLVTMALISLMVHVLLSTPAIEMIEDVQIETTKSCYLDFCRANYGSFKLLGR